MMLRKLVAPFAILAMLCMTAGSASAGFLLPLDSKLSVSFGALQKVEMSGSYQHGGWATVSNNGTLHDLTDTSSIWNDSGISVGTSLLTGVALLTNLTLTAVNETGSFTASFSSANPWGGNLVSPYSTPFSGTLCPSGCLGGYEGLTGQFVLGILGTPLAFPLDAVGGPGTTTTLSIPTVMANITVTAGPWITGKARITGVTTNVISLPTRGGATGVGITLAPTPQEEVRTFTTNLGFVTSAVGSPNLEVERTITLSGTNTLASASAGGMVTLISPLRIITGPLGQGTIPGKVVKKFVFVPEPGTVLLLVSGAAGLVFIGRKRMKS